MFDLIIYFVLFIIIIFQSIIGIGILVIGTPILLILNIDLVETISILLPISITTSFFNFLFFYKKKEIDINLFKNENNYLFFFYCLPSILLGILLLKNTSTYINYNHIVGTIIILSVILSNQFKIFDNIPFFAKKCFLIFLGIIHGSTNSGGSLLALFISSQKKINPRQEITFFYLFLGLFQFFLFISIFGFEFINFKYAWALLFCPILIFLGDYSYKKINEKKFKFIINIIAILASISLILKS